MTLEQLTIFIAVAERQHLTKGASAVGLTPSAVSSAIKALEGFYNIQLFDRVGRGIELTRAGKTLLDEARQTMARVRATESVLSELGGLKRGSLDVFASQTITNYWLPARLFFFAKRFPGITINFESGNTTAVAKAVLSGKAELGFIEGSIQEPSLGAVSIGRDRFVVVSTQVPSGPVRFSDLRWIMREPGSGTRSEFESAVKKARIDPASLQIVLTLPTNESVLNAVLKSDCAAALSETVVAPFVQNGELHILDFDLPAREFTILRHKERRLSAAAREFEALCREPLPS